VSLRRIMITVLLAAGVGGLLYTFQRMDRVTS
jgi:hypothetical protein